jgi:hypothetical protein
MNWKTIYTKDTRPTIVDVEGYLSNESLKLFKTFVSFLSENLNLSYVKPKYSLSKGWSFDFGRSGLIMLKDVTFENNNFYVNGFEVNDISILQEILQKAETTYHNDFLEKFNAYSVKRSEEQKERDASRRKREQAFIENSMDKLNEAKFNKYRWSPPVSRDKIKRLYESDAKGLINSELLDDIGFAIYTRCLQGQEECELMDMGKIKCHNCGEILNYSSGIITCKCSYQYMYRDYRRSFRANNMPTGGAAHIFNKFISEWPRMKSESEKMLLIDWLIHEFHINLLSGSKGRFVGINLIQGTKAQIKDLILSLAYGNNSIISDESKRYFENNL